MLTLPRLDEFFWSAEYQSNPEAVYDHWLATVPVWWSDRLGGVVVVRYDDVKRVMTEHATFGQSPVYDGAFVDAFSGPTLPALDPPEHTALRKALSGYFRAQLVDKRFSAAIRRIVTDIVDGFAGTRVEIYQDFTDKLVSRVTALMIGGDMGDPVVLAEHNRAVISYMRKTRERSSTQAERPLGKQAGEALISYLSALYDERAELADDQPDLMTALARTSVPKDDCVRMAALALVAGVDTTVRGIANTIYALLLHPEALQRVRQDPSLADPAFTEALRWMTPISLKHRLVRRDTEIAGVPLSAGDHACVLLGAANRDPRHYDDPGAFHIGRDGPRHMAFGTGAHYCLGAPLATIEARHSLQVLLGRFPRLSADLANVEFADAPANRSPHALTLDLG